MADVVARETVEPRSTRATGTRAVDVWIALTALTAAMLALPFAQNSWHGPEVASALAVSATAMLAGQRWAIALVVIAEALLLPTVVPRAFAGGSVAIGAVHFGTIALLVPGLVNVRRGAPELVSLTGWSRSRVKLAMATVVVLAGLLPLF